MTMLGQELLAPQLLLQLALFQPVLLSLYKPMLSSIAMEDFWLVAHVLVLEHFTLEEEAHQ